MNKVNVFKQIILEFQNSVLPDTISRDLQVTDINKIISIYGPRRSGKTFFLYSLIGDLLKQGINKHQIIYINLEDDRLYPFSELKLDDLLTAYYELFPENIKLQKYFFLDEIQNIEHWELFVRRIYDKEMVKIYVTGSSSNIMHTEIYTGLRGRTLAYMMFPLSFLEYLRFNQITIDPHIEFSSHRFQIIDKLRDYINYGGFPELVFTGHHREILSSYYNIMLLRDVAERYKIRNIGILRNIAHYLMTNIGNQFSINSYYKSVKSQLSTTRITIAEYYRYLLEINLFCETRFFSYSVKQQQSNPVKVYCIDTGLRNSVAFKFSRDMGRLMENVVMVELMRRGKEVYYWKSKSTEVDFVYLDQESPFNSKRSEITFVAINVFDDTATDISFRELKGLQEIKKAFLTDDNKRIYNHNKIQLILITMRTDDIRGDIQIIPLWKWLLNLQ